MGQVSSKLRRLTTGYAHYCPACEEMHVFSTDAPNNNSARWTFNGDVNRPTFAPSMLIRSGHYVPGQEGKECWCSYEKRMGEPPPFSCRVCHYILTAGVMNFCADSTHKLSGQAVPLPDLPVRAED